MAEKITSYKLACVIARFLDEKLAKNISILNISNVSSFADYFVICSAQTNTQVKALTENLTDKVKSTFTRLPLGRENDAKNRWNLVDYGDVVVHHAFSIPEETWLKESEEYSEYNVEK